MREDLEKRIFQKHSETSFEALALDIFEYQSENNVVYGEFLKHLNRPKPTSLETIPFIPIQFFKSHTLNCLSTSEVEFTSSGTGKSGFSTHHVAKKELYNISCIESFTHFYGNPDEYVFLALLPNYLERQGSSLVYMMDYFIERNPNKESGFFLYDHEVLFEQLQALEKAGRKTILIGVSFALLDFFEKYALPLKHTIVMETGGMKGQRKEITREELHGVFKEATGLEKIHSEYGMTELLSQGYSTGNGVFECPPWMKVIGGDTEDPLSFSKKPHGNLKIIDFSNLYSCAFIQTQDLGRFYENSSFEVLGRIDYSDVRGCNLMVL
ncbi:MAG: acyl transferase [Flavobacteriales bacterium]